MFNFKGKCVNSWLRNIYIFSIQSNATRNIVHTKKIVDSEYHELASIQLKAFWIKLDSQRTVSLITIFIKTSDFHRRPGNHGVNNSSPRFASIADISSRSILLNTQRSFTRVNYLRGQPSPFTLNFTLSSWNQSVYLKISAAVRSHT